MKTLLFSPCWLRAFKPAYWKGDRHISITNLIYTACCTPFTIVYINKVSWDTSQLQSRTFVTGQQKEPILPKLTDDMFVRTVCFQRDQWKCALTYERLSHPWLTKLKPSSQVPGSTDGNQEVSFPIDTYGILPPGYRPVPKQACRIFKEPVILAGSLYCDWRVSLSEIDDLAHGLDLPHQTLLLF